MEKDNSVNLGEFRKVLKVYNRTINNYIKTYDLNLVTSEYIEDKNNSNELRDYHIIKPKLKDYLLSIKDNLIEYENDFYASKKPIDISNKIGVSENVIIDYLNLRHDNFVKESEKFKNHDYFKDLNFVDNCLYNLDKNKQVNIDTIVKYLSSYQILKEIRNTSPDHQKGA